MRSRICVGFVGIIVVGLATPRPAAAAPVQWTGNGNYYDYVLVDGITFEDADAAAESASYDVFPGHLATVTSALENAFIADLLKVNPPPATKGTLWLGGFQPAGSSEPAGGWQWVTGEEWYYTNWYSGEPNEGPGEEDYLNFHGDPRGGDFSYWNDLPSVNEWIDGYLIEYESSTGVIPEPSTLIIWSLLGGLGLGVGWWRRRKAA